MYAEAAATMTERMVHLHPSEVPVRVPALCSALALFFKVRSLAHFHESHLAAAQQKQKESKNST